MAEEAQVPNESVETNEDDSPDWQKEVDSVKAENKKLQQAMTRQGYELGELRKLKPLVDKVLLEKQEPVDFFADPEKAVSDQIASHPKVKEAEERLANLARMEMTAKLKEAHPDYMDVAQDTSFQEWVSASKIRTQLFQQADQGYDFDAASELLTSWNDRRVVSNTATVKAEHDQKQKENLSKAKVDSGSGASGKKTYSRIELMKLKQSDPDLYQSLNVSKLYSEGRVR